ncbi:MAG: sulfatase [Planctomycetota bacterium]|nr:MAG: sulfatase [Planctomycetota bacterium]
MVWQNGVANTSFFGEMSSMTNRFSMLCVWGLFVVGMGWSWTAAAEETRRPNIILILVDDLGWRDWSGAGNDICRTPHIDALARDGMRFDQAYAACAVCSPTRAAVQTGRYPARVGVTDWIRSRFQRPGGTTPEHNPTEYVGGKKQRVLCPPNPFWMELDEVTLAEMLRAEGYHTGYIGKWHLGDEAWYPEHQGFEENFGGCDYGQPPSYFDPFNQPRGRHETLRAGIYRLPSRRPGEYLTDREADEACGLIERWKDDPFFIQLSHYAVHTPLQAPADDIDKFSRDGVTRQQATYAAMVASVDRSLGRIRAKLKELNLEGNTILWFTSDNGGLDNNGNPTENAPLRAGKGFPYEGGIRVPQIIQWPGVIPAGGRSDVPVSSIDIVPTLAGWAGVEIPSEQVIDGIDLGPHVVAGGKQPVPERPLLWHFPHYRGGISPYSILREGEWKLITFYDGDPELYNLRLDPGETSNVATQHPQRVKEMGERLHAALEAMGARFPIPNPNYDPS